MDEGITTAEQRLYRDGESPEKIRHYVNSLQRVKLNVSTYVQRTYWAVSLIAVCSLLFPLLIIGYTHNESKKEMDE